VFGELVELLAGGKAALVQFQHCVEQQRLAARASAGVLRQQARDDEPQVRQRDRRRDRDDVIEVEQAEGGQAEIRRNADHQQVGRGADGRRHAADQHRVVHWQQGSRRAGAGAGGDRDQHRHHQHHDRRVVDESADADAEHQDQQERERRRERPEPPEPAHDRLERAGPDDAVTEQHQEADRHQRRIAEAGKELLRAQRPVVIAIGKNAEQQHQRQQREQRRTLHRQLLLGEQVERHERDREHGARVPVDQFDEA
jgi:hypothetical protein